MNKSNIPDKQIPKFTFNFEFDEIGLILEQLQYREVIDLMDWFKIYKNGEKYRKNRPSVRPTQDPRAWWKFASIVLKNYLY